MKLHDLLAACQVWGVKPVELSFSFQLEAQKLTALEQILDCDKVHPSKISLYLELDHSFSESCGCLIHGHPLRPHLGSIHPVD